MTIQEQERFTEDTLFKVYDVLRDFGMEEQKARDAIQTMRDQGILFRERVEEPKKGLRREAILRRSFDEDEDDDE